MRQVVLADAARRVYERADRGLQARLDRCFEQLRTEPRRHPNIKLLTGQLAGYRRYRVGDYRVVYRIEDDDRIVVVVIIAHRSEVYRH